MNDITSPSKGKQRIRKIAKILLIVCGTISVALGILGMFLPLLPTTPFLLLAAFCYARSSDRFYEALLNNRWFGPYIRNFREGRGLPMRQKVVTLLVLWLTIVHVLWFFDFALWIKLLLVAIAAGVTLYLLSLKTYRPAHDASQAGETSSG